jgi:ribosomal protein L32E
MVYNVSDLTSVTPENQVARIGGAVGGKKRAAIIEEAGRQNIRILNAGITEKKSDFEKLEDDKK